MAREAGEATGQWEAPESFDDFVRARHIALLRFAYVLAGDRDTADDLVQDALVHAGMRWRRIRRQDDPEAYLRRSILNGHLNRRRFARRERLTADVPDTIASAPDRHDDAIWQLLATLPRQQRAVVVLRFYEDLSEADIARLLECSVGTVKSTGARAMAKLKAALAPNGDPHATEPVANAPTKANRSGERHTGHIEGSDGRDVR